MIGHPISAMMKTTRLLERSTTKVIIMKKLWDRRNKRPSWRGGYE